MENKEKTILITGGAGFIGSNFIAYTLQKYPDYKVVCVDKLTYAGNKETLRMNHSLGNKNFVFYKADICDNFAIRGIFDTEKPDIVINFAAESHVDRSIENPMQFIQTNVVGTQVLLNACLKNGVRRFHQISTDEVYGGTPLKSDVKFTEESPLCPSTPYSASKASADLLVMAYINTFGLDATISRCSNNYGPYQHWEKLIPLTIQKLLRGEKLTIHGQGDHVRDWIHVYDHCDAIDRILQNGESGRIYNIAGNNPRSVLEVMERICDAFGMILADIAEHTTDRAGNDMRYAMNACTMKNHFGWEPKMDFVNELNNTVDWYLNNQNWIKSFEN